MDMPGDTFVLFLNDMRSSNIENLSAFLRGYDPEEIASFVEREQVEAYQDGRYCKTFRQGGPLEWANPPGWLGGNYGFITNVSEKARELVQQFDTVTSMSDLPPSPASSHEQPSPE